LLAEAGFDGFVESACATFYDDGDAGGRPSVPPGNYFRMLFVGYFEGIDSQRGIAWRCADSLSLREFLGLSWKEASPDHSSLTKVRKRADQGGHGAGLEGVLEAGGGLTLTRPVHRRHRGRGAGMRHGQWFTGPYFAVYGQGGGKGTVRQWQEAMGIDWTDVRRELAEAIPPAYTEHLGHQTLAHLLNTPAALAA